MTLKLCHIVWYLLFSFFSYETPVCESNARSKSTEVDDPFKDRELPGQRGTRYYLCLLTTGPLRGKEYYSGDGRFLSPCMFYHGFYSVLFWITSSFSSELEKAGSALGAGLLPVCPSLKTCLGSEFSGKKPGCLEVPWGKNGLSSESCSSKPGQDRILCI